MPWTCKTCDVEVPIDDGACATCGSTKATWTIVADRTRTLVFSAKKVAYLRGHRRTTYPPDDEAHTLVPRVPAEVAPVVRKACAAVMAARGHLPPSWHVLHVRLFPGAAKQVPFTISVNMAVGEAVDHALPQEVPALRPDGSFDARVLLVWGPGDPPAPDAFPGLSVVDVTEVGPDGRPGLAPSVDVAAQKKRPHQLPTEDAGALELGVAWFQAHDLRDGEPVKDTLVQLHGDDGLEVVGSTDAEGVFRWKLPVALGFVTAEVEGYEPVAVPVLDPDEPEPYQAGLWPRRGHLLVEVHDERGELVVETPYGLEGATTLEGTTDALGRLEHRDVPEGVYRLQLQGRRLVAVPTLAPDEGVELEPHRVQLGPETGTVLLQLFDPAGEPLADVDYQLEGDDDLAGTTDGEGRLRHDDVAMSVRVLVVDGRSPAAVPTLALLQEPPEGGAELEPHRVLLPEGGPLGTLSARVFDAAGEPVPDAPYRLEGPRALRGRTGSDGALRHEGVPLDYYTLRVEGFEPVALPALSDPEGHYALQIHR